jgi:hypothetical protein
MTFAPNTRKGAALLVGASLLLILLWGVAVAQQPTQEERIAALKQSMAASQEALKGYQWTESTTVKYEGEEKSHTQAKCYYGDDGKVVKEPLGDPPAEPKKKRGLRGRKAASKQAEIKEYMGRAKELIASYVPPNPENIQKCKDDGKISIEMVEAGKRIVLRLKDYQLPGDSVGIEVDLATNTMLGYEVSSYLDSPDGAVKLNVTYDMLEDGTIYPLQVDLDAAAESIKVEITNTDYRHAGN